MLEFFTSLGDESHNSNKLNNPFLKGVNQLELCTDSCQYMNYIETSEVLCERNIIMKVDITYGKFDQSEQLL